MTTFKNMPQDARLWVYQSNRILADAEVKAIEEEGLKFISDWAAHGASLKASFDVLHNLFVVIAVDEKQAMASGCSIDKSVHFVKELEQKLSLNLFDRMQVAYRSANEIKVCKLSDFVKAFEDAQFNSLNDEYLGNITDFPIKYITYTKNGVDGKDSLAWSFYWIAPAAETGDVTFYGGFNSNYEWDKGGDQTFLSTLKVKEKLGNALPLVSKNISNFSIYPNPTNEVLNIRFELKMICDVEIDITDLTGKKVAEIMNEKQNGVVVKQINTAALADGNYFVRIKINGNSVVNKILITH